MPDEKIVLLTHPYDQGDILRDYIEWHLDLGVDYVIAQDLGSSDETHEILDRYAAKGRLHWFVMPERNQLKYKPDDALARMAIEQFDARWIIMNDVDEFLCLPDTGLRPVLETARGEDVTAISVPCFNMTGSDPEKTGSALEALTHRIDKPYRETAAEQASGNLAFPYVFIQHPPKTITCASAFVRYTEGTHSVTTSHGKSQQVPGLKMLHYPIRRFDKLEKKVRNTAAYLADNAHLAANPGWGWHWRRWIRLNEEGRLRDDYDAQFVSGARAQQLVADGVCAIDETVATWARRRRREQSTPWQRIVARLFG